MVFTQEWKQCGKHCVWWLQRGAILKPRREKSWLPIMNIQICEGSRAFSASAHIAWQPGSKKTSASCSRSHAGACSTGGYPHLIYPSRSISFISFTVLKVKFRNHAYFDLAFITPTLPASLATSNRSSAPVTGSKAVIY